MEDKVLETVVNGLEYSFEKDILVKPLAPIMVTKEYTEQIPTLPLIHISEPTRQADISYAVFCLKKKMLRNEKDNTITQTKKTSLNTSSCSIL